ncbi:signal peptidase I [Halobacteriales archaeon QH_10_70_21]|jgi:hypothetical protein|nr:MAG: signal peptidase I [Halobacteriales archaeon QH_10_70_21]
MYQIPSLFVPLQGDGPGGIGVLLVQLLIFAVVVAGLWKTFEKAGEPGWAAIIPIYNAYVIIKISGNAWWWLILLFIPIINFFALAKISIDVADTFGQGALFGIGLWLLSFVFYPVLGFGDYQYQGSAGAA